MNNVNSITVTIPNPTPEQIQAIASILGTKVVGGYLTTDTGKTGEATLAGLATSAKKGASKKAPAKTVSEDEDEDFGKEELDEEDLADEDSDEDEESDDEEDEISFEDVRVAVNQFGGKNPEGATAILTSFGFKSVKELKGHKNKWEPIYRKVMAQIKKTKKSK